MSGILRVAAPTVVAVCALLAPSAAQAGSPPTCTQPPVLDVRPEVQTWVPGTCVDPDGTATPFFLHQRLIVDPPDHGTVTTGFFPGELSYTSDDGYTGSDAFVTVARDADGHGPPVLHSVNVTVDANRAPICASQPRLRVRRDAIGRVDLGCSDLDQDDLTYAVASEPERGTLRAGTRLIGEIEVPFYNYSPHATGDDRFAIAVSDGRSETVVQVETTVFDAQGGEGPSCEDEAFSAPNTLGIRPDCTDPEADDYDLETVDGPGHGTVAVTGSGQTLLYDAEDGFTGTDSFTYRAADEFAAGPVQTITITVPGPAPQCPERPVTPVRTGVARDVFITCTSGSQSASAAVTDQPDHGTVTQLSPGSTFRYVPEAGYNGPDSFTLTPEFLGLTGPPRTYALEVSPTSNVAPVCGSAGARSIRGATVDVAVGCTDADGDTIDFDLVAPPENGALGAININPLRVAYTPAAGFAGVDAFSVRADDGHGGVVVQRHEISATAAGSNNRPSCLGGGTSTAQDTAVQVPALCGDPDGDAVSVAVIDGPDHGTLNGLVYTPAPGFVGTDSVVLRPSDAGGPGPRIATAIRVGLPGFPEPTCIGVATTVEPGASRRITLECTSIASEPQSYSINTVPSHGSLSAISGNRVTYTADAGFTGNDAITYRGHFAAFPSGTTATAPAAVLIDVRKLDEPAPPAPDPPDPAPQSPQPPPTAPPGSPPGSGPVTPAGPKLPRGFAVVRGLDLGSAKLAMRTARTKVPGNGRVTLAALVCPQACSMRWSAELRTRPRARFRGTLVSLPRGGQQRISIRLSAAERRRVRRARSAIVRLKLRVRDAAGAHDVVRSVRLRG